MGVKLRSELGTTRDFANVLDTMLPTPVAITDAAAVSLVKSSHQGRVLLVPDPSAEMTITIPAPAQRPRIQNVRLASQPMTICLRVILQILAVSLVKISRPYGPCCRL